MSKADSSTDKIIFFFAILAALCPPLMALAAPFIFIYALYVILGGLLRVVLWLFIGDK